MQAVLGEFFKALAGVIFFGLIAYQGIRAGKRFRDYKDSKKKG